MTDTLGLYLHIPFCRRKCLYCDFPSYAGLEKWMEPVVERMAADLRTAGERLSGASVGTMYVGGGTPSLLPPKLLSALLLSARRAFPFKADAECSMELNPGTATEEGLDAMVRGGINRVSVGVQSASDTLLKALGRIHTFEDARRSVQMIRRHGIENLNLDMMLGLPGQTLSDVQETLDAFFSLKPTHISCYALIVEPDTPFQRMADEGRLLLPDEDVEREMYELARQTLEAHGYRQYEISNFARAGYECRHNVDCWERREYLGIGCAACGFIGRTRYKNPSTVSAYLSGQAPEYTELSDEDARFESLMLGLRLTRGVSLAAFERMHGAALLDIYGKRLEKPLREGLVELADGRLYLTRRGMDVQNAVLVELME